MPTYELDLELRKRQSEIPQQVVVRVGDNDTQTIKAHLLNDGDAFTATGWTARLDIMHADGTWARCNASVSGSTVTCTLPSEALSVPGLCKLAHFVLTKSGQAQSTEGFALRILRNVDTSNPSEASKYYDDALSQLYDDWADEFAALKSQSQAATSAANGAATNANNAAAYARSVADNLQSSVVGDEEVARMKGQIDTLGSMLANATDGFLYMDGTVYCPSSKTSVSGSTFTFGSTCSASGSTVTLA